MGLVCSADAQSDCYLPSSEAAHFSKVSCVSEVSTQTLTPPAECAAVSPTAAAAVNLCSLLISVALCFLSSHGPSAWTGAVGVSQACVKCSRGAVGLSLKA